MFPQAASAYVNVWMSKPFAMLLAWLCFTKSHSLLPLRPQQKKKWAFVWIICCLWPSHVWWWSMTEWSAWSRVFLTLAQRENVPHLQRRHSTGAPRLSPDTFLYTGSSLISSDFSYLQMLLPFIWVCRCWLSNTEGEQDRWKRVEPIQGF